jgi:predicted lipoprotein
MRVNYILIFAVVCTLSSGLLSTSCKKKKKNEIPTAEFDRAAMLTNIGNNIIIPNYQTLVASLNKLDSAIAVFNTTPTAGNLSNLQNIFKDAYRAWQYCSVFDLGKADDEFLRITVNTFPIDSVRINTNVFSGTYSLDASANVAAKGFPGLDFLLFGTGPNNTVILAKYTSDVNAAKRKQYLSDLCTDIKTKTTDVLNSWLPTGGNYISTFVSANGTDVGSSTGKLVNELNEDLEVLKNAKIGIPLGKQSNGAILPANVEAYYSGMSVELASLQIKTSENIYLGKDNKGNDGLGFDDYLAQLDAKAADGSPLNDAIKNQYTNAYSKMQLVPNTLSNTVQTNPAPVEDAYRELQKLVVYLKTDMASAMAILITFQDNDGD